MRRNLVGGVLGLMLMSGVGFVSAQQDFSAKLAHA